MKLTVQSLQAKLSPISFLLEWSETRRRFIAIAFQPCFGIHYQESPGEPERTEIEQDTPALARADDVNIVG
jgi:hypothetical protein